MRHSTACRVLCTGRASYTTFVVSGLAVDMLLHLHFEGVKWLLVLLTAISSDSHMGTMEWPQTRQGP